MAKGKPLTHTCRVLSDVTGRSVLVMGPELADIPLIVGGGMLSMRCGSCEKIIADSINVGMLTDMVIQCTCGAYNETNVI